MGQQLVERELVRWRGSCGRSRGPQEGDPVRGEPQTGSWVLNLLTSLSSCLSTFCQKHLLAKPIGSERFSVHVAHKGQTTKGRGEGQQEQRLNQRHTENVQHKVAGITELQKDGWASWNDWCMVWNQSFGIKVMDAERTKKRDQALKHSEVKRAQLDSKEELAKTERTGQRPRRENKSVVSQKQNQDTVSRGRTVS